MAQHQQRLYLQYNSNTWISFIHQIDFHKIVDLKYSFKIMCI